MRCPRLDQAFAVVAAFAAFAGCAPVQREDAPKITSLGYGTVEQASQIDTKAGENANDRAVLGFLSGGLIGLAAASSTEANLNRTMQWKYDVRIGTDLQSFFSHAVVAPGDCVQVETMEASTLSVLTRVEKGRC